MSWKMWQRIEHVVEPVVKVIFAETADTVEDGLITISVKTQRAMTEMVVVISLSFKIPHCGSSFPKA